MTTGVPMGTFVRPSMSSLKTRTQPWDTIWPRSPGFDVPWIAMRPPPGQSLSTWEKPDSPSANNELLRVLGVPWVLWFLALAWVSRGRDHLEGDRYAVVVYGSSVAMGFGAAIAMLADGGIVAVLAALYLRVVCEAAIMPQRRAAIGLATMVFFWAVAAILGPPDVLWVVPFQLVLFGASFALGAIAHRAFDDVTRRTPGDWPTPMP